MNLPDIEKSKAKGTGSKAPRHSSSPSPVSAMYEPPASMRGFDQDAAGTAGVTDTAQAAGADDAAAAAAAERVAAREAARAAARAAAAEPAFDSPAESAFWRARRKRDREMLPSSQRMFYNVVSAVGIVALCWVAVQMMNILALPIGIIIWTALFMFILNPMVGALEQRGINRTLGTTIAFVALFVILGLIVFFMVSPAIGLGDQMKNLAESIPGLVATVSDWVNSMYAKYADILSNESLHKFVNDALGQFAGAMQSAFADGAASIMGVGTGIANVFVSLGFGLVIAFWLLMELPALGREVKRLISPSSTEDFQMLNVTINRIMGGYIFATLVQCAIIAVCCCILFTVDGSPNPLALGVITGILNIIPVVGPWFGGALAAIAGIIVSPVTALVSLAGTIVIQQLVYTFVSPRLMENSVDIHPALTLFALMVGSALGTAMSGLGGALVGALIAIPAAAVIKAEFAYYFEKRTGRHLIAEDGVFFQGTVHEEDEVDPLADATSAISPSSSLSLTGRFMKVEDENSDNS